MYRISKDNANGVPSPFVAMVNYFNKRSAAVHAAHLLPYLHPDLKLLDIGCGGGSIMLDLAKILKDGKVIGLDVEQSMSVVDRRDTLITCRSHFCRPRSGQIVWRQEC